MANTESNRPGSFCWIELSTSDQEAAKKFYGSLLGWTVEDSPMGPNDFYSMFKLEGRTAGAAYTTRPDEQAQGVPPHWNLYIAVENADDTAAKAGKVGGKVLAPAFDVMDVGRMAVIQDPTGAAFCVWQAKKNAGLEAASENGAFCWADLSTPDPGRAGKFYSDLLGWELMKDEKDPSGYLHIKNGETMIGGIPPTQHRDPHAPPHWLIYFQVADVEAATAKAKDMGATVHMAPRKMEGVGTWAVLADPQGAAFSLFKSAR